MSFEDTNKTESNTTSPRTPQLDSSGRKLIGVKVSDGEVSDNDANGGDTEPNSPAGKNAALPAQTSTRTTKVVNFVVDDAISRLIRQCEQKVEASTSARHSPVSQFQGSVNSSRPFLTYKPPPTPPRAIVPPSLLNLPIEQPVNEEDDYMNEDEDNVAVSYNPPTSFPVSTSGFPTQSNFFAAEPSQPMPFSSFTPFPVFGTSNSLFGMMSDGDLEPVTRPNLSRPRYRHALSPSQRRANQNHIHPRLPITRSSRYSPKNISSGHAVVGSHRYDILRPSLNVHRRRNGMTPTSQLSFEVRARRRAAERGPRKLANISRRINQYTNVTVPPQTIKEAFMLGTAPPLVSYQMNSVVDYDMDTNEEVSSSLVQAPVTSASSSWSLNPVPSASSGFASYQTDASGTPVHAPTVAFQESSNSSTTSHPPPVLAPSKSYQPTDPTPSSSLSAALADKQAWQKAYERDVAAYTQTYLETEPGPWEEMEDEDYYSYTELFEANVYRTLYDWSMEDEEKNNSGVKLLEFLVWTSQNTYSEWLKSKAYAKKVEGLAEEEEDYEGKGKGRSKAVGVGMIVGTGNGHNTHVRFTDDEEEEEEGGDGKKESPPRSTTNDGAANSVEKTQGKDQTTPPKDVQGDGDDGDDSDSSSDSDSDSSDSSSDSSSESEGEKSSDGEREWEEVEIKPAPKPEVEESAHQAQVSVPHPQPRTQEPPCRPQETSHPVEESTHQVQNSTHWAVEVEQDSEMDDLTPQCTPVSSHFPQSQSESLIPPPPLPSPDSLFPPQSFQSTSSYPRDSVFNTPPPPVSTMSLLERMGMLPTPPAELAYNGCHQSNVYSQPPPQPSPAWINDSSSSPCPYPPSIFGTVTPRYLPSPSPSPLSFLPSPPPSPPQICASSSLSISRRPSTAMTGSLQPNFYSFLSFIEQSEQPNPVRCNYWPYLEPTYVSLLSTPSKEVPIGDLPIGNIWRKIKRYTGQLGQGHRYDVWNDDGSSSYLPSESTESSWYSDSTTVSEGSLSMGSDFRDGTKDGLDVYDTDSSVEYASEESSSTYPEEYQVGGQYGYEHHEEDQDGEYDEEDGSVEDDSSDAGSDQYGTSSSQDSEEEEESVRYEPPPTQPVPQYQYRRPADVVLIDREDLRDVAAVAKLLPKLLARDFSKSVRGWWSKGAAPATVAAA